MRDVESAVAKAPFESTRVPEKLPTQVYAVMALTTALTFATLNAGYELFFTRHLVAEEVATNYGS